MFSCSKKLNQKNKVSSMIFYDCINASLVYLSHLRGSSKGLTGFWEKNVLPDIILI